MRAYNALNILGGGSRSGFPSICLAAVACFWCLAAQTGRAADEIDAAVAPPAAPAQQHLPALEQRITLMSTELGLDEPQRAELRRILINQRMQIMRLWSDTSVPAASRVGATRVLSERTGDQIRALLNEEQKAKYNRPRKPRDAAADPGARSVEDWMNAASRN